MVRRLARCFVPALLLCGTALLGGCYVAPYPYAPRYAYGTYAYPAPVYAPAYYHRYYYR